MMIGDVQLTVELAVDANVFGGEDIPWYRKPSGQSGRAATLCVHPFIVLHSRDGEQPSSWALAGPAGARGGTRDVAPTPRGQSRGARGAALQTAEAAQRSSVRVDGAGQVSALELCDSLGRRVTAVAERTDLIRIGSLPYFLDVVAHQALPPHPDLEELPWVICLSHAWPHMQRNDHWHPGVAARLFPVAAHPLATRLARTGLRARNVCLTDDK
jgi:hypothetical protein